jgi:hypothetical protein
MDKTFQNFIYQLVYASKNETSPSYLYSESFLFAQSPRDMLFPKLKGLNILDDAFFKEFIEYLKQEGVDTSKKNRENFEIVFIERNEHVVVNMPELFTKIDLAARNSNMFLSVLNIIDGFNMAHPKNYMAECEEKGIFGDVESICAMYPDYNDKSNWTILPTLLKDCYVVAIPKVLSMAYQSNTQNLLKEWANTIGLYMMKKVKTLELAFSIREFLSDVFKPTTFHIDGNLSEDGYICANVVRDRANFILIYYPTGSSKDIRALTLEEFSNRVLDKPQKQPLFHDCEYIFSDQTTGYYTWGKEWVLSKTNRLPIVPNTEFYLPKI